MKKYLTGLLWRTWAAFLPVLFFGSCSSVLQFQDATPLGRGVAEVSGGFGAGYYPAQLESNNYGFPFTAALRFGVSDRSDLGIRYSLKQDVELNFKHNLLNSKLFLMSAGLYAGMDEVFSADRQPYVGIPLFFQVRFGNTFSLYGIPAVSMGRFESKVGLSGNIGVSFGRRDRFFIEAGFADYDNLDNAIKTFGVGFAHRL